MHCQLRHLNAVQRRMLRSIVGWVRVPGEEWSETMRRMNGRLQRAQDEYPTLSWSQNFSSRQHALAGRVARRQHAWPYKAAGRDLFARARELEIVGIDPAAAAAAMSFIN